MIYVAFGLSLAVAVVAVGRSVRKVLRWRHRERDLAVRSVEEFDLNIADRRIRGGICSRMLDMLRADVEFCLAHNSSPRTVGLALLFALVYAVFWLRVVFGLPPRRVTALCWAVRRLSGASP